MKYVLIIIEGAADAPQQELDGRTPLQVARCAQAASLAEQGQSGLLKPLWGAHGYEHALGLFCGMPEKVAATFCRGPVEAAAVQHDVNDFTHAYCGNFITMDEERIGDPRVMRLSLEETTALSAAVQEYFDKSELRLFPLAPGRVVALVRSDSSLASGEPPALVEDKAKAAVPSGKKGKWIREVLDRSENVLRQLTLNDVRVDLGENPATHLWLWGGGPLIASRYSLGKQNLRGTVLTQSPLAKGLARLCNADILPMRNPWSEDSDPVFDQDAVGRSLAGSDFLLVYVEAPADMGRYGSPVEKVRYLERVDLRVLKSLMEILKSTTDVRLVLTSDGFLRGDYVDAPITLWGCGVKANGTLRWDERACAEGALGHVDPTQVFNVLMGR